MTMLTTTRMVLTALVITAFATPSLAQDYRIGAHYSVKHERSSARSLQLIEGRNAAVFDAFSPTSTDRESLVRSLGN
jgi:hypothetical protein